MSVFMWPPKLIQQRGFTCFASILVAFDCEFISSFEFSTDPLHCIQDRTFAPDIQQLPVVSETMPGEISLYDRQRLRFATQ